MRELTRGVEGTKMAPSVSDDGKRVAFLTLISAGVSRVFTAATEGVTPGAPPMLLDCGNVFPGTVQLGLFRGRRREIALCQRTDVDGQIHA